MILRTIASVLDQDWPAQRMTVIVSDDGHDRVLEHAVARLPVEYFSPPDRFAAGRDGAAKAGNLNAAVRRCSTPSTRRSATSRRVTPTTSSARTASCATPSAGCCGSHLPQPPSTIADR